METHWARFGIPHSQAGLSQKPNLRQAGERLHRVLIYRNVLYRAFHTGKENPPQGPPALEITPLVRPSCEAEEAAWRCDQHHSDVGSAHVGYLDHKCRSTGSTILLTPKAFDRP